MHGFYRIGWCTLSSLLDKAAALVGDFARCEASKIRGAEAYSTSISISPTTKKTKDKTTFWCDNQLRLTVVLPVRSLVLENFCSEEITLHDFP